MPLAWQALSFPLACHALRVSLPRTSREPAEASLGYPLQVRQPSNLTRFGLGVYPAS